MNFAGNIETFFTGEYTVTRRASSTLDANGREVIQPASTFVIRASCMPGGQNLEMNPEGLRTNHTRMLYTTSDLKVISQPDQVAIDGAIWEVQAKTDYKQLGNFYEYTIVKVGDGV